MHWFYWLKAPVNLIPAARQEWHVGYPASSSLRIYESSSGNLSGCLHPVLACLNADLNNTASPRRDNLEVPSSPEMVDARLNNPEVTECLSGKT
jgi:hypothetical protein